MIPKVTNYYEDLAPDFTIADDIEQPSLTYKLDYHNDRVKGCTNGQEAMKQAIYKILNTERYDYKIYSSNYGVELKELIGEHIAYVIPEAERRIKEAILWDSRITDVFDFEFEIDKKILNVKFKCSTIFGEVNIETVVNY